MCLVVHKPFDLPDGRKFKRGDVLFGEDADTVARSSFASRCTAPPDEARFAHLKPAEPVPEIETGGVAGPIGSPTPEQKPTK